MSAAALNLCSNHQSCGCNTETTRPGLCFIFSTVPVASCLHRWSPLWFTKHSFFFFFNSLYTALEVLLQNNNIMLLPPPLLLREVSHCPHGCAPGKHKQVIFAQPVPAVFYSRTVSVHAGLDTCIIIELLFVLNAQKKTRIIQFLLQNLPSPRFLFDSPSSSAAACVCVREFLCVYWI